MRVVTIHGTLNTIGESISKVKKEKPFGRSGPDFEPYTTYRYLSFTTDDGDQVMVEKVKIWIDVARILRAGGHGSFVLTKAFFEWELHAARVDGVEATSEFIDQGLAKNYRSLIFGLLIFLALSVVLIGIPFVLLILYAMIRMPGWRRQVVDAARAAGFQLKKTIRL